MILQAPFTLIVQGIQPCSRLAPSRRQGRLCRLPGFIGPVPPPARDKSIRTTINVRKMSTHVNFFLLNPLQKT